MPGAVRSDRGATAGGEDRTGGDAQQHTDVIGQVRDGLIGSGSRRAHGVHNGVTNGTRRGTGVRGGAPVVDQQLGDVLPQPDRRGLCQVQADGALDISNLARDVMVQVKSIREQQRNHNCVAVAIGHELFSHRVKRGRRKVQERGAHRCRARQFGVPGGIRVGRARQLRFKGGGDLLDLLVSARPARTMRQQDHGRAPATGLGRARGTDNGVDSH